MRTRALFAIPALILLLLVPTSARGSSRIKWNLSFVDDFNGTKINRSAWSLYGWGGPDPPNCRDPANVVVSGGTVDLKVKPVTGCLGFSASGMCACAVTTQTYGKYEVRMKAEPGATKITFLLWGANDWPPEIDFAEFPKDGDGALRLTFNETLHYGSKNHQIHSHTDANMTVWHVVGLEWSPGRIAYTLDGVVKTTITSHVPAEPMWMALQTAASDPPPSTIDTWIDWVHVYTYVSG